MKGFRSALCAGVFLLLTTLWFSEASAQSSLFAREGTFRASGVRLYYKRVGTGEPIVVLHGGPGINHSYFLPQMGELAGSHQLIFLDQRAHGRSSSPRDTNAMRMKNFVDDVEALRQKFRLGRMNLMGHSWGALVALSYAVRYPENLKTLILVNPIAANDSLLSLASLNQSGRIAREDSARLAEIMRSRSFQRRTPSALDRYFRTVFRSTLHDSRYADSLTLFFPKDYAVKSEKLKFLRKDLAVFNLYPRLRVISAPTVIIRGNDDPTPLSAVEMIRDSIPGATMKTIPRSGHFPFIEQREAFFNAVRQFLNEQH